MPDGSVTFPCGTMPALAGAGLQAPLCVPVSTSSLLSCA